MSHDIESRLKELGVELPEPSEPRENYVPYMAVGVNALPYNVAVEVEGVFEVSAI